MTLIPHRDGSWTAAQGDFREKVETVIGGDGAPVRFPNEDAACRWAWERSKPPAPVERSVPRTAQLLPMTPSSSTNASADWTKHRGSTAHSAAVVQTSKALCAGNIEGARGYEQSRFHGD